MRSKRLFDGVSFEYLWLRKQLEELVEQDVQKKSMATQAAYTCAMLRCGAKAMTPIEANSIRQKYYWSGVPCFRDHISPRRACNAACMECDRMHDETRRARRTPAEWAKRRAKANVKYAEKRCHA